MSSTYIHESQHGMATSSATTAVSNKGHEPKSHILSAEGGGDKGMGQAARFVARLQDTWCVLLSLLQGQKEGQGSVSQKWAEIY